MTECYVLLHGGSWSLWDDKTPKPSEVSNVICSTDDPEWMEKVNSAVGHVVFSAERITQEKKRNSQSQSEQ